MPLSRPSPLEVLATFRGRRIYYESSSTTEALSFIFFFRLIQIGFNHSSKKYQCTMNQLQRISKSYCEKFKHKKMPFSIEIIKAKIKKND